MKISKNSIKEFLGIVVYGIIVFLTALIVSSLISYWILEAIR